MLPRGFEEVEDAEVVAGLRLKSIIVRRPLADARLAEGGLVDDLLAFARDALPTVKILRPAARDLADLTPGFTSVLKNANYLLNTLAYNPAGDDEGYLFWVSWLNHIGPTVFSTQDAHGPIRRGALFFSCSGLGLLDTLKTVNPQLSTIIGLTNAPAKSDVCATTAQAPATNAGG